MPFRDHFAKRACVRAKFEVRLAKGILLLSVECSCAHHCRLCLGFRVSGDVGLACKVPIHRSFKLGAAIEA